MESIQSIYVIQPKEKPIVHVLNSFDRAIRDVTGLHWNVFEDLETLSMGMGPKTLKEYFIMESFVEAYRVKREAVSLDKIPDTRVARLTEELTKKQAVSQLTQMEKELLELLNEPDAAKLKQKFYDEHNFHATLYNAIEERKEVSGKLLPIVHFLSPNCNQSNQKVQEYVSLYARGLSPDPAVIQVFQLVEDHIKSQKIEAFHALVILMSIVAGFANDIGGEMKDADMAKFNNIYDMDTAILAVNNFVSEHPEAASGIIKGLSKCLKQSDSQLINHIRDLTFNASKEPGYFAINYVFLNIIVKSADLGLDYRRVINHMVEKSKKVCRAFNIKL